MSERGLGGGTGPGEAAPTLAEILVELGLPAEEVAAAAADGSLALVALDHLALPQRVVHDLATAVARTGMSEDDLRHLWRSLGFPEPLAGEPTFTDEDLRNLRVVGEMLEQGAVPFDIILAMTRVIGSSMAKVASAVVDTVTSRTDAPAMADATGPAVVDGEVVLSHFPEIFEQVWRRHLQVAARRRLLRGEAADAEGLVVGFADLVGFTALSQQASDAELAGVVDHFEHLTYDIIVGHGGRVVKMIGDEVMFVVEDPEAAAEIALELADASRDADQLTDVRVGMALGPALEREGDVYGPTVNLASRATGIAYPGTVVVSAELREALGDHPGYVLRSIRPRTLKNIGRVTLWTLRRADDPGEPSTIRQALEDRRRQVRDAVTDVVAGLRTPDEP